MTPPGGNGRVGFNLFYGRPELGDITVLAGANDMPSKPGDAPNTASAARGNGCRTWRLRPGSFQRCGTSLHPTASTQGAADSDGALHAAMSGSSLASCPSHASRCDVRFVS
jgi:hypothetical protein